MIAHISEGLSLIMATYKCPCCERTNITSKQKRKAGYWSIIYCADCKARLCIYPWLLAALWTLYVWDVAWFAGLYYFTHNYLDFVYMTVGWILLDYINVTYMPLVVMKQITPD